MSEVSTAPQKNTKKTKTKFNIGVITPLLADNDSFITCKALEAACSLGFNVSVLAEGDEGGQKACFSCAEQYPKKFSILENMGENRKNILEKSDVVIFSHMPSRKELTEISDLGVVPILPEEAEVPNFDSKSETGCAFTYDPQNIWTLVAALVRASENRKFSWDWKTIKQNLVDFTM